MLKKVFFLIFILNLTIIPGGRHDLLHKVRKRIESIKPFRVKFTNLVLNDSVTEIEEKGEMIFLDNKNIKWVYIEPDHKVWILKNDSYEYYDKEEEQITRGKLEKKTQLWLWQLFFNEKINDDIKTDPGRKEIRFFNEEEGVDFTILVSDDLLPYKIIQKDPTGVDIVYIFSEFQKNVIIKKDEFKLKITGQVDIIELK